MYNNNNYNSYGYGGYYPQGNTYNHHYQQQVAQQPNFLQLTFVNSLEEAKAYIVAPNTSIYLRDNNSNKLYIKSCDNTGRSMLEEYDLNRTGSKTPNLSENIDFNQFVTMSVFDALKEEYSAKFSEIEKKLGGINE